MEQEYEIQITTVGDIYAAAFEREARNMPASHKDEADALLEMARLAREHDTKQIRVWRPK